MGWLISCEKSTNLDTKIVTVKWTHHAKKGQYSASQTELLKKIIVSYMYCHFCHCY